jgi:hypothetical protein
VDLDTGSAVQASNLPIGTAVAGTAANGLAVVGEATPRQLRHRCQLNRLRP